MSAPGSNQAEALKVIQDMVAEAAELKQAAGGSVTDAVAAWLAPPYVLAARDRLTAAVGAERLAVLRAFAQDWALLRHGDHTAERLDLERARLDLARQDARKRWEPKIRSGLEELAEHIKNNPQAGVASDHFKALVLAGEKPQADKEFRAWLQRPEIRKEALLELARGLSPETIKKIEDELRLL